jgi:hypothetical protein
MGNTSNYVGYEHPGLYFPSVTMRQWNSKQLRAHARERLMRTLVQTQYMEPKEAFSGLANSVEYQKTIPLVSLGSGKPGSGLNPKAFLDGHTPSLRFPAVVVMQPTSNQTRNRKPVRSQSRADKGHSAMCISPPRRSEQT